MNGCIEDSHKMADKSFTAIYKNQVLWHNTMECTSIRRGTIIYLEYALHEDKDERQWNLGCSTRWKILDCPLARRLLMRHDAAVDF